MTTKKDFLFAAVASTALALNASAALAHPVRVCDDDGHCWRTWRHDRDWDRERHGWRHHHDWDDHYGRAPHRDFDRDRDDMDRDRDRQGGTIDRDRDRDHDRSARGESREERSMKKGSESSDDVTRQREEKSEKKKNQ